MTQDEARGRVLLTRLASGISGCEGRRAQLSKARGIHKLYTFPFSVCRSPGPTSQLFTKRFWENREGR